MKKIFFIFINIITLTISGSMSLGFLYIFVKEMLNTNKIYNFKDLLTNIYQKITIKFITLTQGNCDYMCQAIIEDGLTDDNIIILFTFIFGCEFIGLILSITYNIYILSKLFSNFLNRIKKSIELSDFLHVKHLVE